MITYFLQNSIDISVTKRIFLQIVPYTEPSSCNDQSKCKPTFLSYLFPKIVVVPVNVATG